jgi:hypothetical protein
LLWGFDWLKTKVTKQSNPLPVADLSPSREDWQAGDLWLKFKGFAKGTAWALAFVAAIIAFVWYMTHDTKPINVGERVSPAVVSDIPVAENPVTSQKSTKTATNKIANKAINTPATASSSPEKAQRQLKPLTPAEQDFANLLATLESKL